MPSVLGEVAHLLTASGVDLPALGLAWARVSPTVALVPAFGLRALPAPVRGVFALALAASIYPALVPDAEAARGAPWIVMALAEVLRGLPIAIAAAVPLWAATMAGGVVDALRGASESSSAPTIEGRATPLGVPFSLLACAIFLSSGGPARTVAALATRGLPVHPLLAAAHDLTAGITLAVSIGGPLLAASVVLEVAGALIARAASPAQLHALLAPLRALGILAILAIVLDRAAHVLARAIRASP